MERKNREAERDRCEAGLVVVRAICVRVVECFAFYIFILFVYFNVATASSEMSLQQRMDPYLGEGKQFKVKVKNFVAVNRLETI